MNERDQAVMIALVHLAREYLAQGPVQSIVRNYPHTGVSMPPAQSVVEGTLADFLNFCSDQGASGIRVTVEDLRAEFNLEPKR